MHREHLFFDTIISYGTRYFITKQCPLLLFFIIGENFMLLVFQEVNYEAKLVFTW